MYADKFHVPLHQYDKIRLFATRPPTDDNSEEVNLVRGLFVQGATWDESEGVLLPSSSPLNCFVELPVVRLEPHWDSSLSLEEERSEVVGERRQQPLPSGRMYFEYPLVWNSLWGGVAFSSSGERSNHICHLYAGAHERCEEIAFSLMNHDEN